MALAQLPIFGADEAIALVQARLFNNNANPNRIWLKNYIQNHSITIQGLIHNDTFGELSDFDEDNPAPTPLMQVHILKSFLNNESTLQNYDINAVCDPIKLFTNNIQDQEKNLDHVLLNAQLARQESWNTQLSYTVDIQLKRLNILQLLNEMQRMLGLIAEESSEKTTLQNWIAEERTSVAKNQIKRTLFDRIPVLNNIRLFIRDEIKKLVTVFRETIKTISDIAQLKLKLSSLIKEVSKDTMNIALLIGKYARLPYFYGKRLIRFSSFFIIPLIISFITTYITPYITHPIFHNGLTHPLSLKLLSLSLYIFMLYSLNLPIFEIFPASWSLDFIATLSLSVAAVEVSLGVALGIGQKIFSLCNTLFELVKTKIAAHAVEPVVQSAVQPEVQNTGSTLNNEQKNKLLVLLMREQMSIDSSPEIPMEKKIKKKQKIAQECIDLRNTTFAYSLSKLDKKILAKQSTLPEIFKNLKDEIKDFPASNPSRSAA